MDFLDIAKSAYVYGFNFFNIIGHNLLKLFHGWIDIIINENNILHRLIRIISQVMLNVMTTLLNQEGDTQHVV